MLKILILLSCCWILSLRKNVWLFKWDNLSSLFRSWIFFSTLAPIHSNCANLEEPSKIVQMQFLNLLVGCDRIFLHLNNKGSGSFFRWKWLLSVQAENMPPPHTQATRSRPNKGHPQSTHGTVLSACHDSRIQGLILIKTNKYNLPTALNNNGMCPSCYGKQIQSFKFSKRFNLNSVLDSKQHVDCLHSKYQNYTTVSFDFWYLFVILN